MKEKEPVEGEVGIVLESNIKDTEQNPLLYDEVHKNNQDENHLFASDANKYPSSVPFIMVNETCERFCYYGLRAVLALYLNDQLGFSTDSATVVVHAFTMFAYTTTLFGGYISDAILGKYKTILYVSMIYCLGCFVLSFTALPQIVGDPPHWWGMALGLFLIACGTGGIKPVVSTFVGDQFAPNQSRLLDHVFFLFYFCINLGSVLSTIITPLVRSSFNYATAFAVPAVLIFIACIIFYAGSNRYKRNPPTGSVLAVSIKVITTALRKWITGGKAKDQHWLDLSLGHFPAEVVADVSAALGVLFVFVPLPLFWALFDQHSSRWIFQAKEMDRSFWGVHLDADQVPAIAPLLVLICVPLFDKLIYPGLTKIGLPLRPLQRMSVGMVVCSFSFVYAAFLQLAIDRVGDQNVHILWQLPQYVILVFAEIMVSITGLELSYSQAPKSMKSLIMAGWLLTVSIGNLVVMIVAESKMFPDQAEEFFFFAAFMLVAAFLFIVIAYKYKYVEKSPTK